MTSPVRSFKVACLTCGATDHEVTVTKDTAGLVHYFCMVCGAQETHDGTGSVIK